ncbi:PspC domain-containing protein [Rhodococcus sp. D2-41]|nr:PspC domain-containing protein [Rhodococcus sp. D2-41]
MPSPRPLVRRSGGRVLGGVAGGLADHLGVDAFKVRVAFMLLSALAGAGICAYGLLWILTKPGGDTAPAPAAERRRALGLLALGIGFAIASSWLFSGTAASVIVPVIVVAAGAALVWREFDANGPRSLIGMPRNPTVLTWARVVGGVSLVVLGLGVVVLARVDLASLRSSLLAVVVTLIGVGLLTVPIWLRTMRVLGEERAARIRNEEREEIASHLHDSVLQTLALIQKQADRPQEVARLARSQERELRKWLFGGGETAHAGLAEALRMISGEVEDQYGVAIAPVTVGDLAFEPGRPQPEVVAVVGAAREALVNAAKHSGVSKVDLYAEVESDRVSVFVRDRGRGFDPETVDEDRQGLARSIRGRVERRGGKVQVRSSPGKGTEVRIVMPLAAPDTPAEGGRAQSTVQPNGVRRPEENPQ